MRLPFIKRSHPGGAERTVPEPSLSVPSVDPLESLKGYLAGDVKGHPYRNDIITEINQSDKTKDLSAAEREALVNEILARRDKKAQGGQ